MGIAAELIPDAGERAVEDQFFRSSGFYEAEGVTHTLALTAGDASLFVPLVVRAIPGTDLRDAVSPYSYPSGRREPADADPLDADQVDWSATGLVSIFVRDRVGGGPLFTGATERSTVFVSDPAEPRKSRPSDRRQARRNTEDGFSFRSVEGPKAPEQGIEDLTRVYLETMRRIDAAERYMFDRDYFATLLAVEGTWLAEVIGPDGDVAAAAIAARSDGMIHYYLSGTADDHARRSPSKNLIFEVIGMAEEMGMPMNLGGGVKPGDALESFKRGFGNTALPYRTHEIVCDRAAYEELSSGIEEDSEGPGFFPLYRKG